MVAPNSSKQARFHRDCMRLYPNCLAPGCSERSTEADHIIPSWAGGSDDPVTNGQGLCKKHEKEKTAAENKLRPAGLNGQPLPANL